jgi:hypothetical protein
MLSNLLSSPIKALKDLQASLTVWQSPIEVQTQAEDPSWMHTGFTINAALHMGLDKFEEENLFRQNDAGHAVRPETSTYRRRTWLQAFIVATQYDHGCSDPLRYVAKLTSR